MTEAGVVSTGTSERAGALENVVLGDGSVEEELFASFVLEDVAVGVSGSVVTSAAVMVNGSGDWPHFVWTKVVTA